MLCVCSCRRGSMCRPGQGAEVLTRPRVLRWRVNLRGRRGRDENMRSRGRQYSGGGRARKAAHVRWWSARAQGRTWEQILFRIKCLNGQFIRLDRIGLKRQRSALFRPLRLYVCSPQRPIHVRACLYVCFCVASVIHKNKMTEYEFRRLSGKAR